MIVEFRGVQKKYNGSQPAIRDASFKIDQGEFVYLMGPSGAGKSTLLNMMHKEEFPSRGEIYMFGRNIKKIKTKTLRRSVAYIFQDYRLLPRKTALENVAYVLECLGKSPYRAKRKAIEALYLLGIGEHAKKYPEQLSGGMQQRVAIARAIVTEPGILLCDEPTGNVDAENTRVIMNYLKELNGMGTTVIMATHDQTIVEKHQKRVLYIENGRLNSKEIDMFSF